MNWEIKLKPESKKLVYTEGVGSIVLNATLFILKYWVGMNTGSIAIVADAWHTLSDSLTSIVVILGAKVSSKPADFTNIVMVLILNIQCMFTCLTRILSIRPTVLLTDLEKTFEKN